MASTPEGKVKDEIKKYLTSRGVWLAGKPRPPNVTGWMYMPVPTGMGVNGIPDFCGTINRHAVYIEAKADNGVLSGPQEQRHEEIQAAGGVVIVARSAADVANQLTTLGVW